MGLQRFPVGDFRGGWNIRDAPTELEANEAQALLNVDLSPVVATLKRRDGKTLVANEGSGGWPLGYPVHNMKAWYPDNSTKIVFLSMDGTIQRMLPNGTMTDVSGASVTSHSVWSFEAAEDAAGNPVMWAMNGVDAPRKWTWGTSTHFDPWTNTPPNGTILTLWRNRMVVSGVPGSPSRVFFSDIGDPEMPAAGYGTSWVDLKATDEDMPEVTEAHVFADKLYVFKRTSTWAVSNSNPPWDNARLLDIGCLGRFQSTVCEQKLYFLSNAGVYSVDANNSQDDETSSVNPLWLANNARFNFAARDAPRLITTASNRVLAAIPLDGSAVNNYTLEIIPHLNYRRLGGRHYIVLPAIVLHSYDLGAMCRFRLVTDQEVVIAAATSVNKIHQLFNGVDDDGSPINGYWMTGWKPLIAEEPLERLRRVNLVVEGHVVVETFRDMKQSPNFSREITTSIDSDSLWDGGVWDDGGTWDPQSVGPEFQRVRPESRGRYHAVKFKTNPNGDSFVIHTAELAFRGGKEN